MFTACINSNGIFFDTENTARIRSGFLPQMFYAGEFPEKLVPRFRPGSDKKSPIFEEICLFCLLCLKNFLPCELERHRYPGPGSFLLSSARNTIS
jgi:hypothetical protein